MNYIAVLVILLLHSFTVIFCLNLIHRIVYKRYLGFLFSIELFLFVFIFDVFARFI